MYMQSMGSGVKLQRKGDTQKGRERESEGKGEKNRQRAQGFNRKQKMDGVAEPLS